MQRNHVIDYLLVVFLELSIFQNTRLDGYMITFLPLIGCFFQYDQEIYFQD